MRPPRSVIVLELVDVLLLSGCAAPAVEPHARAEARSAPPASAAALPSSSVGVPTPPATAGCPEPPPCSQGCVEAPRALAVGKGHACVLAADGTLSCWGENAEGQLGDGTREPKASPIVVARAVRAVAADDGITCVVEAAGVRCLGGLGHPLTVEPSPGENENVRRAQPLSPPIRDAVSIAAGGNVVCTLDARGNATCFLAAAPGSSTYSIYGSSRIGKPARVKGATDLVEIAPGTRQSCGRTKSGSVLCWNTADDASVVQGLTGIESIAVTYEQACAADLVGKVWCWQPQAAPRSVDMPPVSQVRGGGYGSICARMRSGEVSCWGRLGNERYIPTGGGLRLPEPVTIRGTKGATLLAVGAGHACAATSDGVRCWGSTQRGALGDGRFAEKAAPVRVPLSAPAVEVATHLLTTCAVLADGRPECWGHGYARDPSSPAEGPASSIVSVDAKVAAIAVGEQQSCALAAGAAWCWPNVAQSTATGIAGVDDAIAIAPGINGGCAAGARGGVRCWWPGAAATALPGVGDFVDIGYLASDFSCGRRRDGTMSCWTTPLSMPGTPWPMPRVFAIPGIVGAIDISPTCATNDRGDVACMGSASDQYKARPVSELTEVTQLDGSESYLCGRTRSGSVRCRGIGANGELGAGATGPEGLGAIVALRPSTVSGIGDAKQVAVGREHACALRADGSVWCWGSDFFGQASGVASGLRMCARRIGPR